MSPISVWNCIKIHLRWESCDDCRHKKRTEKQMDAIKIDWCATRKILKCIMHAPLPTLDLRDVVFFSFYTFIVVCIFMLRVCSCSHWLISVNLIETIHRILHNFYKYSWIQITDIHPKKYKFTIFINGTKKALWILK